MTPKPKRATATFNRRESCATLSTPERDVTAYIKLRYNGDLILELHHGGTIQRREFSKAQGFRERWVGL